MKDKMENLTEIWLESMGNRVRVSRELLIPTLQLKSEEDQSQK